LLKEYEALAKSSAVKLIFTLFPLAFAPTLNAED